MRKLIAAIGCLSVLSASAQNKAAQQWADSVFKSLTPEQRIAQLMVVRLSTYDRKTGQVTYFDKKVSDLVKQYNIGSVCVFQGAPVMQAKTFNALQAAAKTPLLMCIDAEWGLGMRLLDSVMPLPKQMMLGAMQDSSIVYEYGKLVAGQCKRFGIQVNYAPVVDVNNNPSNPVINERSFGEDKYKVSRFGIQYMKGLQDNGVMACAKHFPGHGDVAVDSHLDLPVINKSLQQLDSLELYPFRQLFKAGVASAMIAHLYIPAIDTAANRATSLSKNNVTGLLRNQLGFQGLTFTDALGMKGVAKFFPDGEIAVQALIAGNDMLCLPDDIPLTLAKIKKAIAQKKLSRADLDQRCKKVLLAKYYYGLANLQPVDTMNLVADLNKGVAAMRRKVAENALTVLAKDNPAFFPFPAPLQPVGGTVALVSVGTNADNAFAKRLRSDYQADVFYFDYKQDSSTVNKLADSLKKTYKQVIIGVHAYSSYPANNFGISKAAVDLVSRLQQLNNSVSFVFGNPYAIKNWCGARNLVACYEDDEIVQQTAADLLEGKINPKGTLPVTVCDQYHYGSGIAGSGFFVPAPPAAVGLDSTRLSILDSIAADAISKGATPGCVVLVARNGRIAYEKAYGNFNYGFYEPVDTGTIYDMASVTKVCATTLSLMKLYDEGKLDLQKRLGDYLPWTRGSDKENIKVEDMLLHQGGLVAYIPFYKEMISPAGVPLSKYFSPTPEAGFGIRVAENLYMRTDWRDTIYKRILQSPLGQEGRYIYSDNDFIFLGKIVEAISGLPLDEYVQQNFYQPLGLLSTGFKPRERFPLTRVAPTEDEKYFRLQHLHGDVHDPGAALFGGVSGHAGLFSNAHDLAVIMEMLVDGGSFNGKQYIKKETIRLFSSYHSPISRRGYGFDKPEKDNTTRPEPYPCLSNSPYTFGHTGFTGTCVWADPASRFVFIFLSNRVNPEGGDNKRLLNLNVRGKMMEAVYQAMIW